MKGTRSPKLFDIIVVVQLQSPTLAQMKSVHTQIFTQYKQTAYFIYIVNGLSVDICKFYIRGLRHHPNHHDHNHHEWHQEQRETWFDDLR